MYIFPDYPTHQQKSAWIQRSLQIGDCFDVLLHNKSQQCPQAFDTLRKYGIELRDDTYILVQFDSPALWTADLLLTNGSLALIDQIFVIWGNTFTMHLFTSDGCLYALLIFPEPFQGERFMWSVNKCCQRLFSTKEAQDVRVVISQDEQGVQGIFHAANSIRYGLDYLRFFSDTPRISFLNLRQQTSLGNVDGFSIYRRLALSLGERLGDDNFRPEAVAQEILQTLREHSSCSIESLHGQMQSFNLIFLNHLLSQSIVDEEFIRREQISRRIMEGDQAQHYLSNLAETLRLLHDRRKELNERYNTDHLSRVRAYTEQHIDSMDLSVSQIADHFGVNRSQLTAQFRAYFGQSLAEFIHNTRLDRAMLLMESHPTRSIEQIARDSGYCSLSTMYRAFQKSGLCSPAQYRQNCRK